MHFLMAIFFAANLAQADTRYDQVKKYITDLAHQFPATTELIELGDSDSGEKIMGLRIGNGPTKNLLVATHHGNEYGSTEVAKGFAASLAQSPIPGQTMYVFPVLNISGYNANSRYERLAGEYLDPNRNYPGPCGTEGPFTLKSTHALANFVDREQVVGVATLHTYFPAVVYPWGISTHDLSTPYDADFKKLVELATQWSHYQTGNSTEVIYPADGTFEDYVFWKHGIWSLLYELGYSHSPDANAVEEMIRVNVPGLRAAFAASPLERAPHHDFSGKCDARLQSLDRHDE
jgi:predicted deacylase